MLGHKTSKRGGAFNNKIGECDGVRMEWPPPPRQRLRLRLSVAVATRRRRRSLGRGARRIESFVVIVSKTAIPNNGQVFFRGFSIVLRT